MPTDPVLVFQCQHYIKAHPSDNTRLVTVAEKENSSLEMVRAIRKSLKKKKAIHNEL